MAGFQILGSSARFARFRALLDEVKTVAAVDCTVLLQSETGTGKKVVARAIHDASSRRHHRFVATNCFLDQIGEELQPKLLRVLQEQQFERRRD